MPVFPSGEWMQAFCDELASHPGVDRVAAGLAGTYRFVVQPAGRLTSRHVYDVTIGGAPHGGVIVSWSTGNGSSPTLELTADYERWRQLISGTLDIPIAVMLGRLRVRGDLGRITRQAADTGPLLEALRSVETTWL
jgi:hypothetical protein